MACRLSTCPCSARGEGGQSGGVAVLLVAAHIGDLLAHLFLGAADQLDGGGDFAAVAFVEVGVHAYPRQATVVRPAAGLDVVLQHLAALIRTVELAHGADPDAAGTRPMSA